MTKEELIEFLKENLLIECIYETGCYGSSDQVKVKLNLGKEELSYDIFSLPSCDKC